MPYGARPPECGRAPFLVKDPSALGGALG